MRIISPDALVPPTAPRTTSVVAEAWAESHRQLRAALADPQVSQVMVMIGCPGCGKSTWARSIPDDPSVVAFDAVHSDPGRRASLVRRIRDAGREAVAVVVSTPLAVAIARNARRLPNVRVPEAALRKAWGQLQAWPVRWEEGWSDVIRVAGTETRHDRVTDEDADRKAGRIAYRWRTRQDGRVRKSHALRHGRLFSWNYPPDGGHPGEDYGCRCTAEMVRDEDVIETRSGQLRARPLTIPKWARQR